MKTIQLRTKSLSLPDCWEDLTPKELTFTMRLLIAIKAGKCTPQMARLLLLKKLTGYRPSIIHFNWPWRHKFAKTDCDMVQLNLVRLSELLDFPFHWDGETDTVLFHFTMKRNPIPILNDVTGKFFDIGPVVRTNITAQEFCDAFDAYKMIGHSPENVNRICTNLICAILYPKFDTHNENINSRYPDTMSSLDAVTRFTILFWFQSICEHLYHHPLYSILFRKTDETGAGKYSTGMDEIIMHLSLAGFDSMSNLQHIGVIDFFDLQVANLRQSIREALTQGAKSTDLSAQMHLSLTQISDLNS